MSESNSVHVIGGGLAGCEAAWQLLAEGFAVIMHEMRPEQMTPAHQTGGLAELVCSNSFRSDDPTSSAVGLLHEEMRRLGSLVMTAADANHVPAGTALAVDREGFSSSVERALMAHPNFRLVRGEVHCPDPSWRATIVATGPLTSAPLAEWLQQKTGCDALAFFDAIAPIVHADSIDFTIAWRQSRYDRGEGSDYVNCPLDQQQYEAFIDGLLAGERIAFRDWEKDTPYFEGCLPIEVMADRGRKTLAFGPMKPVGLRNPHDDGRRPYAVVQLRQDNASGTLFNIVGFQTKLKHAEQVRLFRSIPGLQHAEFARLGGLHRNTFINSRVVLDESLRLRSAPSVRLAGQITGCEGYVESTAIGLLAGRFVAAELKGDAPQLPPASTAIGAIVAHLTHNAAVETFQPMNVNFGLFPPLEASGRRLRGADRKRAFAERARQDFTQWAASAPVPTRDASTPLTPANTPSGPPVSDQQPGPMPA